MATGYESTTHLSFSSVESTKPESAGHVTWSVVMRDGPLRSDPNGFDHEISISLTRMDSGDSFTWEIDGHAPTWETFRRLAASGVPELVAIFGGQRIALID